MSGRGYALAFVCVLALFVLQGAFIAAQADSFSYQFSATVNQAYGDALGLGYDTLGTVTGTFTIDTSAPPGPCPSQGCFNTENPPALTSSLYWTPTNGPTVPLAGSIDIATGGAVDTVPETCSLDAGTWCGFLIGIDADSSGYGVVGDLAFGGYMGQSLAIGGYDSSYLDVYIPNVTVTEGADIYPYDPGFDTLVGLSTATVTPEPSTALLFLLGTILVFISGVKARRFWGQESPAR